MVTLVSTTCSETLETEHWLFKDKDLWLAEERGLGTFREPQGPRPGRQQEKAALNCSRNLPWETEDSHKDMGAGGGSLGPRDTLPAPAELSVSGVGEKGRAGVERAPRRPWHCQGE